MVYKEPKKLRKPVDYPRLRELINKARGNRTLRQYAVDARVDHAVLYKIMNNDSYKPGISVLERLASDSANPQGGVSLTDLLNAAGFPVDKVELYAHCASMIGGAIPIVGPLFQSMLYTSAKQQLKHQLSATEQEQVPPELSNYLKMQSKFKAISTGIIFSSLAAKGITFQPGNLQSIDTFGFRPDDYIIIINQKIENWWFKFSIPFPNKENLSITYSDQANTILQPIITAKLDPKRKISFVVENTETFSALKQFAGHNSYRGNLSVILIDTENVTILDEALISTYDETIREDPLSII